MEMADQMEDKLQGLSGAGVQHSIAQLPDGKKYVRADRQVIFGNDPDAWSEQVEDYINGRIRRGQDVSLIAEDGGAFTITTDTAGKMSSQYANDGTALDEEVFVVKANAAVHIDELIEISTPLNTTPSPDYQNRHPELARNGWLYRTAFFHDFDGKHYKLTLSVASGDYGNVPYNIGKIERRSFPNVSGPSTKGGAENGKASSKETVPYDGVDVKQYSVSSAATKQDVVNGLKDILHRGGDINELRRYVAQVEQTAPKAKQNAPRADQNTREAEHILRSAKRQGISVEEYLSQNWELYETETGWDPAARKALELEKGDNRQFSFSGQNSLTADESLLDSARRMRRDGVDAEEIRQQTGWFVGKDGQWRFEIDDSQMELSDTIHNYIRLGELIQHEKLFAAYPDLAYIQVTFENKADGHYGTYNRQFDSISLSSKLTDPGMSEALKDALIHEIQHAIQDREGFTAGATVEGWNRKIQRGFDSRRTQDIRKAQETERKLAQIQQEQPEFYRDMMELEAMTPTASRGAINWDTLEQIEEDPPQWQAFDARRDALQEQYGEMEVWDLMDLLHDRERLAKTGRTAVELYYDTAGEIEARNTEQRRSYSEEQRKNTPPRQGGEDTVLAEGDNRQFSFGVDGRSESYYDKAISDLELRGESKNKPRSSREWSTFNRKFADKTADMQPGEYRKILILTDSYVYLVEADGYMTGYAEERIEISPKNKQKIDKIWEAIYGTYNNGTTVSQWAEIVRRRRREHSGNTTSPEYGGGKKPVDRFSDGEQDSDGTRNFERNQQDSWEIDYETLEPGIMYFDGQKSYTVVETESGVESVELIDNDEITTGKYDPDIRYSISDTQAETEEQQDMSDAPTAREKLPKKAQNYLKRVENELLKNLAGMMNAHHFADRSYLQDIVRDLSEEYLRTGTVSQTK